MCLTMSTSQTAVMADSLRDVGLLERLQWPLLSTRRTNSRLTLFYKAAHNQAGISLDHLQKPLPNTRSADDTTFIALSARKNPYLFSFFPRTITDWNQLSREQRRKPSVNSFRQSLHCFHRLINRHSQP